MKRRNCVQPNSYPKKNMFHIPWQNTTNRRMMSPLVFHKFRQHDFSNKQFDQLLPCIVHVQKSQRGGKSFQMQSALHWVYMPLTISLSLKGWGDIVLTRLAKKRGDKTAGRPVQCPGAAPGPAGATRRPKRIAAVRTRRGQSWPGVKCPSCIYTDVS